jgi:lipopolysaccharide exporter
VDKLMLGNLLKDMVSTYDVALRVNNLAEVPTTTLATILFPQSAKRNQAEGAGSSKYLYEKSVGILLALILPMVVGILLGADWIVQLIGGAKFSESATTLRLTIFYGVFMAFAIQFGTILDAIGKPKINFYITTLGAVVNLICNYLFIKQLGYYGACYGTLVAMTVMFVIMQLVLNRTVGVQTWNCFSYILPFYREVWQRVRNRQNPPPPPESIKPSQQVVPYKNNNRVFVEDLK